MMPSGKVQAISDDLFGDFNYYDPRNYLIISVSAFTGFLDGSFAAEDSNDCRINIMVLSEYIGKTFKAIQEANEENILYYSTRVLKYTHPSLYYCYYAGKETIVMGYQYATGTSYQEIIYNLIYKTSYFTDNVRIIFQIL